MTERSAPTRLMACLVVMLAVCSSFPASSVADSRTRKKPPARRAAPVDPVLALIPTGADARTLGGTYRRLSQGKDLSADERALQAAIGFCLVLMARDGHGGAWLDAIGYHCLPLEGELAEEPARPLSGDDLRQRLGSRRLAHIADLPVDRFQVLSPAKVSEGFPAIARWMLPNDRAVLVRPPGGSSWVQRECCIVVRIRGGRAAVVGGNLLEAWPEVVGASTSQSLSDRPVAACPPSRS
jgi:hypothetical protein